MLSGDVAMNLTGLILLAALSGFIVAVSLRLRPKQSFDKAWLEGEGWPEQEAHQQAATRRSWAERAA